MRLNPLTVRRQVVIVRQYKGIGITSTLEGYHMATGNSLPSRFYNGRIAYQYKKLRVGLTTLRKQHRCHIVLEFELPALLF